MNTQTAYKEQQDYDNTHQEAKQTKSAIHGNDTWVSNTTENSIGNYNEYCYIPSEAFQ
jgi:hypothetical protein